MRRVAARNGTDQAFDVEGLEVLAKQGLHDGKHQLPFDEKTNSTIGN